MAQKPISGLPYQVPNGQIEIPATDPTNTISAPTGTTGKYFLADIINYLMGSFSLHTYLSALAATTSNLTAIYDNGISGIDATLTNNGIMGPLVIDGINLVIGDRVLIKDQTSQLQNGIYIVTNAGSPTSNWVLTRATDFDSPTNVFQYGIILVNQGDQNSGIMFQETAPGPFTIGTSSIVFSKFTVQSITIPLPLSEGGTNANLTASNGGIFYSTATAGAILPGTAVSRQMLQSGSSTAPAWSLSAWPSATTINQILYSSSNNVVTGLATNPSASLVTNSSGVPTLSASMTNGQVVIGATGGNPIPANLIAGTGINISNAANSITISANGGSNSWVVVSTNTQLMTSNTGYTVNNGVTLVTFTTPSVAAVGDWIEINGFSSGGWSLVPNAGQNLQFGNIAPTTSISNSNQFDCIRLRCTVANTTWSVVSAQGELNYV